MYITLFKIKNKIKLVTAMMLLFLACNTSLKAQGVDVIFWMDNSGSIDATEWTNMSNNTKSLIDQVIGCSTYNRVAVVHYYGGGNAVSKIYIETNFTTNATTAKSFQRRGGNAFLDESSDFAHEALGQIGNALDGTANSGIVSTQKTLTRNPNNKLVLFLFTDAKRNDLGTFLVNSSNPNGAPFLNYNTFKSGRGATFVVLKASSGDATNEPGAQAAAAAIASVGGTYNGNVEANAGDPQGSGVKPRKMIYNATFTPSAADLAQLQSDICRSCAPTVAISALTPPSQTVCQNAAPQNLVISATGSGTLSYQWYRNATNSTTGGTAISGANAAIYTPTTTAVGTTYYFAVVTDTACDGTTTSSAVSVTVSNTGSCTPPCSAGTAAPVID